MLKEITQIPVSLENLADLAAIISEIDMAQAGLSTVSIKYLSNQAHNKIIEILGEHELAIYAEAG